MFRVSELLGLKSSKALSHDSNFCIAGGKARLGPVEGEKWVLVVLKCRERIFEVHDAVIRELLAVKGGLNVNSPWNLHFWNSQSQLVFVDFLGFNFDKAKANLQPTDVRLIESSDIQSYWCLSSKRATEGSNTH